MSFYALAKARYSCRSLSDRPVSKEAVSRIIAAGMAAPTACNYQPFRIWVMESEEALAKIKSCTKQKFVLPAPVVFVIGACPEEGWVREFDSRNFAAVDATIAATHMMLQIQDLGLGTTWIGHFDVNAAKELFPDMVDCDLIAMFAVGWPADDAVPAVLHDKTKEASEIVRRM